MKETNKYICQCDNDRFYIKDMPVYYGREKRIHPQIICSKCGARYDIQPCNTNGLKTQSE